MTIDRRLWVTALLVLTGCSSTHGPSASTSPDVSSAPAVSSAAAPSTPAPSSAGGSSPSGGSPSLVPVATATERVLPAVPVSSPAAFGNGVTARLTGSRAVTSQGAGIGQIAGAPAVAVTVEVTNGTSAPVPLGLANVTAAYGPDATPGVSVDGPPLAPLAGTLAPGAKATGTYVFAVPIADRANVTVTLNLVADQPTVVFVGAVG